MKRPVYYNEHDKFAAAWLRELMKVGEIPDGTVDERDIQQVTAADLAGFAQCHFFAGIGGWALALKLAGWPADRPIWTGSCPCQPFSAAGKQKGTDDERHLWPALFRLIKDCRPPVIFGEQVDSAEVTGGQGMEAPIRLRGSQEEPGLSPDSTCEGASEEEGVGLRSGLLHFERAGPDRSRFVRSDGIAAQLGWGAHLGQSLHRSDRPEGAISLREHSGGIAGDQQRDGRLGRAEASAISLSDLGPEKGEVERILAALGRAFDPELGGAWLELVQSDLERADYTVGPVILPAASVGAFHRRQRVWFVAHANGRNAEHGGLQRGREGGCALRDAGDTERPEGRMADHDRAGRDWVETPRLHGRRTPSSGSETAEGLVDGSLRDDPDGCGESGELGDSDDPRSQGRRLHPERAGERAAGATGVAGELADADDGARQRGESRTTQRHDAEAVGEMCANLWTDAVWLPCRDGKWRPVESEPEPVFDGLSESLGLVRHGNTCFYSPLVQKAKARVGRLRGYGNAIVPQVAAKVLRAYLQLVA